MSNAAKPAKVDSSDQGLTAVSCPSASFCVAIDGTAAYTFDGSSWSPAQSLGSGASGPVGVSCPSASLCMAIDPNHALSWHS